ncbi:MAG: hypothetical protein ACRDJ4_05155 [Actinomycetota bacterium]
MVTNPDEDCSPEAFRTFIDDLLAGPEPELDSIGAAEALHEQPSGAPSRTLRRYWSRRLGRRTGGAQ